MAVIGTNLGVKKWQLSATFGKHSELLKWEKWDYLNLIVFASNRELFNRRFLSYMRKSHSDKNLSGFFVLLLTRNNAKHDETII